MRNPGKNLLRLFVCFLLLFFLPTAEAAGGIEVLSGHPRIFITPGNLSTLQERAGGTHAETYRDLKRWCDDNWENAASRRKVFITGDRDYEAGVLRYALVYRLGRIAGEDYAHSIDAYGNKAVETLLDIVRADDRHNLVYAAIAYDWVNERIERSDKAAIVDWFKSVAGATPHLRDRVGYRFAATPYCLYPGLAFYGDGIDDALAGKYVDFIPEWLDDARCASHESGHDGGHAAGLGYGKYVYGVYYHQGQDFYALLTATNLTIEDTFDAYPYMKGFGAWLLYGTQPGGKAEAASSENHVATVTKWEDCGSWQWNVSKKDHALMQALRILVQVAKERGEPSKAEWLTWLINVRFQAPRQNTTWDILFNDRATPAVAPGDLGVPPVKAFGWDEERGVIDSYMGNPKAGLGQVYMKSSWDMHATATHASFKAFPYYYFGHQHFDSLAFSIFKGEPLALPNSGAYFYWYEGSRPDFGSMQGYPHHWYYYNRTVAANSLLVMDPGEVIRMREAYYQSDPMFKDGGQRCLNDPGGQWGAVDEGPPTNDEIRKAGGGRDWGGLIRYEDTGQYTYSSGDATQGYNSVVGGEKYVCRGETDESEADPKVSLVQRDFVYLKSAGGDRDYFVVFDRVESTDPSFRKVFLLHTVGEPLLNGSEMQLYGGPDGGIFVSDDTDGFHMVQDTAQLFMKTLLPEGAEVHKMGGFAESTTTAAIQATEGVEVGGAKISIQVADAALFADVPVVTVDNGSYVEAFACEGKDEERNLLTGCIRGKRYYKYNAPQAHPPGSKVKQDFAWMVREVDTGNWISYPHDYGTPHADRNRVNESDDYGKWALWIETTRDERLSNFLHVLHPSTDMRESSMAETRLVQSGGKMAGCLIDDAHNRWIVLFARDRQLERGAGYQAAVTGPCKHLVTGLEPGVYDIYRDGVKILTKQSSGQNTLYFEAEGGESFQLVKTGDVPNMPPSATAAGTPQSGDAPLTVGFSASGSDVDGKIVSYGWDFGDGATSDLRSPSHTYVAGGRFTATVTVEDDRGATGSASVDITVSGEGAGENRPPSATIQAVPPTGEAPLEIAFACAAEDADGRVVSYVWDFGDGSTGSGESPHHMYRTAGSYSVSVVVKDDDGAYAGAGLGIHIGGEWVSGNHPPGATATADRTSGEPPLEVDFTGVGSDTDGTVISYLWNFDDGTTSTEQNPSHTFSEAGFYSVSLSVMDNAGAMAGTSLGILVSGESSFDYVINDFTDYPVPEMPRPRKGVPFEDPVFHTTITRITDSETEAHGSNFDYAQPGYPKHNIENADGSMLVIQSYSGNGWHIWEATPPYEKIKDIPTAILNSRDPEVRWDNVNPDILYAHKGATLYEWNVETEAMTALHDFSNDFSGEKIIEISMGEEGDASDDRRYWAFFTRSEGVDHHTHLVVYDKVLDRIVSSLDWGEGGFQPGEAFIEDGVWIRSRTSGAPLNYNSVGMSPSGDYVVTGFPPTWVYPRDLSTTRIIDTHGHVDCAIDDEGREVVFWVGKYYGPSGNEDHGNWGVMADIRSGEVTYLAPFGDVQLFHPSGNAHDRPGWAVVSSYSPLDCGTPAGWSDASILMYELTRRVPRPTWGNHARVWRVAHTHMCRRRYSDDPFAKLNKKGTKIFFGSGWGRSVNDGPYDVYQIDLPRNWYQDLMGNMPPSASLAADRVTGIAPLEVKFRGAGTDSDGTIVSYQWDFGDGTRSSEQNVSHTFQNAGPYSVTLLVTDDDGAVGRGAVEIRVADTGNGNDPPVAYLAARPLQGAAPLEVAFTGAGKDGDGSIASYAWDFGDGSRSERQSPMHTYEQTGVYPASLTVRDDQGASGTAMITIRVQGEEGEPAEDGVPEATLSAVPVKGGSPLTVQFVGSGSDSDGSVAAYIWSFGDGFPPQTTAEPTRVHTYESPGNYVATLTVVDDAGRKGATGVDIRVVGDGTTPPDIESASGSPSSGKAPLTVNFSASASDEEGIAYYFWNFGDGGTSVSRSCSHTYTDYGNYIATLTVKDATGAKSCARVRVSVTTRGADGTPPLRPAPVRVSVTP